MEIAWVGDAAAYLWNGAALHQYTRPETVGAYLRQHGMPGAHVAYDAWLRQSLATATVTSIALTEAPDHGLLLLVSDGIANQVDMETVAELCRKYSADPQTLADALVAAAEGGMGDDGEVYRDDATVIVLGRREAVPQPPHQRAGAGRLHWDHHGARSSGRSRPPGRHSDAAPVRPDPGAPPGPGDSSSPPPRP